VVELACLENKCASNGTEGSNPSLSAIIIGSSVAAFWGAAAGPLEPAWAVAELFWALDAACCLTGKR
jgi:hypothetical protein